MKRQSCLKTGLSGAGASEPGKQAQHPVVLDVDLSVDPAKEQEMLDYFHAIFKPAAMMFQGYVDVKMCKLRLAMQGASPSGVNYRFQLTYESEELRRKWATSETHQNVWPGIENALRSKDFVVLLFDSV